MEWLGWMFLGLAGVVVLCGLLLFGLAWIAQRMDREES